MWRWGEWGDFTNFFFNRLFFFFLFCFTIFRWSTAVTYFKSSWHINSKIINKQKNGIIFKIWSIIIKICYAKRDTVIIHWSITLRLFDRMKFSAPAGLANSTIAELFSAIFSVLTLPHAVVIAVILAKFIFGGKWVINTLLVLPPALVILGCCIGVGTDDPPIVGIFLKLLLDCCGGGGLLAFGNPLTNREMLIIYIQYTYLELGRGYGRGDNFYMGQRA